MHGFARWLLKVWLCWSHWCLLWIQILASDAHTADTPTSSSSSVHLELLDYLWEDSSSVARVGNVDVIEQEQGEDLGICHLGLFFPFSVKVAGTRYPFLSSGAAPAAVAATLLAMEMLNKGDGSVIEELDRLNETCPIRFTAESFDTAVSSAVAINTYMEVLDRNVSKGERELCGVMGAFTSASSIAMSLVSGARGIPQISPVASSIQLDNKDLHPLFARLQVSAEGAVLPYLLHLKRHGVKHLAVIHSSDEFGTSYNQALVETGAKLHPELRVVSVDLPVSNPTQKDYETAIGQMRGTGFRWFYGVMIGFQDYLPIMTEALNQGLVGEDYVWQFAASVGRTHLEGVMIEKSSPLALVTEGVGMYGPVGGHDGDGVYDKFLKRWRALDNDQDLETILSKQPNYPSEPDYEPHSIDSVMVAYDPSYFITFNFDSMVMLGLSACKAAARSGSPSFDGRTLFDDLLNTSFHGATGRVIVDPVTGTRDPLSSQSRLQFYEKHEVNSTHVTFILPVTENFEDGEWTLVGNPYVYNGGSTDVPPDLPPLDGTDFNYIGTGLRAAGLAMASVILILSVSFASWTVYNKREYVVMASQPIFLLLLCVGAFVMGASIIPLSIDDEIASAHSCSGACMSVPWLASTGFVIIFSALFSKTLRVNKLFNNANFRRIQVTAFDVMRPFIVLFAVNLLVLSVWTALSPLKWTREVAVKDLFNRTVESRGFCHVSEDDKFLPFVIVLVAVDLGALIIASYQSYLARGISTEFAESEYIAKAIACMLLVSFVGVPTIIIVSDEPRARYFVLTSIIFVLCVSVLLFVFVPKIMYAREQEGASGFKVTVRASVLRLKEKGCSGGDWGDTGTGGTPGETSARRPSPLRRMFGSLKGTVEKKLSSSSVSKLDKLGDSEIVVVGDRSSATHNEKISQISMASLVSEEGHDLSNSERGIRIIGSSQRMQQVESENESLRDVIDGMRQRILELESLLVNNEAMSTIAEEDPAEEDPTDSCESNEEFEGDCHEGA